MEWSLTHGTLQRRTEAPTKVLASDRKYFDLTRDHHDGVVTTIENSS